jgi:hypothetical protein
VEIGSRNSGFPHCKGATILSTRHGWIEVFPMNAGGELQGGRVADAAPVAEESEAWSPNPPRASMALAAALLVATAAWCAMFRYGVELPFWLGNGVFYLMVFGSPAFLAFCISLGVLRHRANFLLALATLAMMWFAADCLLGDLSI